jgi:hypothetical protein
VLLPGATGLDPELDAERLSEQLQVVGRDALMLA